MKVLCAAYGCKEFIKRKTFMCRPHWKKLPYNLRNAIWRCETFVPKTATEARNEIAVKTDRNELEGHKEAAILYIKNQETFTKAEKTEKV